ncbi:hypothetical protein EYF80_021385 [Liparis tanakae]|uniref:Uncharacterized protein n=1 Tax=Liparis tanakae TaxID=230148 RepID=A0A4Z2HTY0_9TELE|nr:hypothetical protein EYF80_021385 [Liparis tanakae]
MIAATSSEMNGKRPKDAKRSQHNTVGREVEEELEVVWQAATRENRQMRETLLDSMLSADLHGSTSPGRPSQASHEATDANQHQTHGSGPLAFTSGQSPGHQRRSICWLGAPAAYLCLYVKTAYARNVRMYVCTNLRMYVHIYICMYLCISIYVCTYECSIYVCMYLCMFVCIYVCMYVRRHVHRHFGRQVLKPIKGHPSSTMFSDRVEAQASLH